MGMPVMERRRWTAAEVRKLNEESPNGPRYEVVEGELLVTPTPAPRHQAVLAVLFPILHVTDHVSTS
jgi:hypothetical protein